MTQTMRLDALDEKAIAALDKDFVLSADGETATITDNIKIEITRPDTDRLLLLIEFANVEFPVLMSRTKTLAELGIKDNEGA